MRQNLIGQVIGTAMQKTAKVRVARTKLVKKLDVVKYFASACFNPRINVLNSQFYGTRTTSPTMNKKLQL
jgi:hypothetical protein